RLQNRHTGAFSSNLYSTQYPMQANALAVRALLEASHAAATHHHMLWAARWKTAALRDQYNVVHGIGLSQNSVQDWISADFWDVGEAQLLNQRKIGAVFHLTQDYWNFYALSSPHKRPVRVSSVQVFRIAAAAAYMHLPNIAWTQYEDGLTRQMANGAIGQIATKKSEDSSLRPSIAATVMYLLATHALLTQHDLGPLWKQATIHYHQQNILQRTAWINPDWPTALSRGPRIALVLAKPLKGSAGIDGMDLAEALTVQGDNVSLFWLHSHSYAAINNMAAFWAKLSTYNAVIIPGNVWNNGQEQHAEGGGWDLHRQSLVHWVQQGGRLWIPMVSGKGLKGLDGVQMTALHHPVETVEEPVGNAVIRTQWPQAASYVFTGENALFQTRMAAKTASGFQPVLLQKRQGAGRIMLSTVQFASGATENWPALQQMMQTFLQGEPAFSPQPSFNQADRALYHAIIENYAVPGQQLFRPTSEEGPDSVPYSALWPYTQVFAGYVWAPQRMRSPQKTQQWLDGLAAYNNPHLAPAGYQSITRNMGGGLTYFDDNGWVTLDLLQLYRDTHNQKILLQAEQDFAFLTTGWAWNAQPAGGEWHNELRDNRTQSSTGAFLISALRLYQMTHQAFYLQWARRITTWDNKYMMGPDDLYNDYMPYSGKSQGRPYAYDTGVMIQADVLWYDITGQKHYLVQAQDMAVAGMTVYTDPATGIMINQAGACGAPFKTIFLQGVLMVGHAAHDTDDINFVKEQAKFLEQNDRLPSGLYGTSWSGINNPDRPLSLLTEGGTFELFSLLARNAHTQ
ncbi:MAG: hypothetical protein OWS74_03860, partial [Firmicutes bacterium]|nr:hypothetical protein [Bacillota bacterium]